MLDQILDALPIPAMFVGGDDRIVSANRAMHDVLGTDLVGRLCVLVLRNPSVLACLETALRDQNRSRTEFVRTDGGHETRYLATANPLVIAGVHGALLCFEDITSMLDARQMRRDFVANVSHELRTPLTALLGYIETLRGPAKNDPAAQDHFGARMLEEATRMKRLIDDLLSLSRVENQQRMRPTEEIDLQGIAETVQTQLSAVAEAEHVTFDLSCPTYPALVHGDRDQMVQVLTNLVENAIKYGGRDKTVRIVIRDATDDPSFSGPAYAISVIDEGEGIDPLHIPRLTERFYRVDSHRSRAVGGTGLGLAIVKHIVGRHRGRFRITSVPGKGSEMTVFLPKIENAGV